MIAPDPGYARKLADLRAAYARQLPDKIQGVEAALAAMLRSPGDLAAATEAYRKVHSLVGSSGTYGFSGVCQTASTLKALVKSVLEGTGAPDGEFRSRAAALLALMRRAAGSTSWCPSCAGGTMPAAGDGFPACDRGGIS